MKRRRILILDDCEKRHASFSNIFKDADLTQVLTFDQAVEAVLSQLKFDIMFLDHDLNDFDAKSVEHTPYGSTELTGFTFVMWLMSQSKDKWPDKVVIHSWNESGASRMAKLLQENGVTVTCIPFAGAIK